MDCTVILDRETLKGVHYAANGSDRYRHVRIRVPSWWSDVVLANQLGIFEPHSHTNQQQRKCPNYKPVGDFGPFAKQGREFQLAKQYRTKPGLLHHFAQRSARDVQATGIVVLPKRAADLVLDGMKRYATERLITC